MKFHLKRPCRDCPFLKTSGYLRQDRAAEIAHALQNDASFACHKTVDYDEEDFDARDHSSSTTSRLSSISYQECSAGSLVVSKDRFAQTAWSVSVVVRRDEHGGVGTWRK